MTCYWLEGIKSPAHAVSSAKKQKEKKKSGANNLIVPV